MRNRIVVLVALLAIAVGLGFTKQGRTVLAHVGLAKACGSSDCSND